MGKNKKIISRRTLNPLFKWEFFRRQESYINDFNSRFPKCKNFIVGEKDLSDADKEYFKKKYNIMQPLNPAYSYFNLIKSVKNLSDWFNLFIEIKLIAGLKLDGNKYYSDVLNTIGVSLKNNDSIKIIRNPTGKDSLVEISSKGKKGRGKAVHFRKVNPARLDISRITLDVDLSLPKERLLEETEEQIKRWKDIYDKYYRDSFRARFDKYSDYLKIYDLRIAGWDWNLLAKRFYEGDVERGDLNYAKRKVKRDYDRCKKLIDGGYRQIR